MNVFEPRNEEPSADYIKSATLVFRQPAFKMEIDKAVKECYAGCVDAIKDKDYVRAELMNDVAAALELFHDRFKAMAEQHAQIVDNNSTSESAEED